jgi:hypothetical protein
MARAIISAHAPKQRGAKFRWRDQRLVGAPTWMATAFLVALALTGLVLAVFGTGTRGMVLALQMTARWSFLLFWLAYVGGAAANVFGDRFAVLARHGREFGLAFASAQLLHVALVIWFIHMATGPVGAMVFFWAGIICTYLLACFSWPRLRDAMGPRLWRMSRTLMVEYIALVFASDFILGPLQADGFAQYPSTYLPFALMLIGGAALRAAAYARTYRSARQI